MAIEAVLLFLVPYALPLLMPSWRWLLAYAFAVAMLLGIWFAIWYQAVMTAPTRTGLEGIGLAFIALPATDCRGNSGANRDAHDRKALRRRHQYSGRDPFNRCISRLGLLEPQVIGPADHARKRAVSLRSMTQPWVVRA